ncbi:hypothetical protein IEQ34_020912 [Dendrobium chrysotoxum]|uniref:Uncharacterized protein n=1 Tax=Dendrobium chrysotoxum TaxID=161865 RepID=A0AAV7G250_DENCH|nr:hypothetical protein IEQ34_020912 [Dendrobium chrysotoxum]
MLCGRDSRPQGIGRHLGRLACHLHQASHLPSLHVAVLHVRRSALGSSASSRSLHRDVESPALSVRSIRSSVGLLRHVGPLPTPLRHNSTCGIGGGGGNPDVFKFAADLIGAKIISLDEDGDLVLARRKGNSSRCPAVQTDPACCPEISVSSPYCLAVRKALFCCPEVPTPCKLLFPNVTYKFRRVRDTGLEKTTHQEDACLRVLVTEGENFRILLFRFRKSGRMWVKFCSKNSVTYKFRRVRDTGLKETAHQEGETKEFSCTLHCKWGKRDPRGKMDPRKL